MEGGKDGIKDKIKDRIKDKIKDRTKEREGRGETIEEAEAGRNEENITKEGKTHNPKLVGKA